MTTQTSIFYNNSWQQNFQKAITAHIKSPKIPASQTTTTSSSTPTDSTQSSRQRCHPIWLEIRKKELFHNSQSFHDQASYIYLRGYQTQADTHAATRMTTRAHMSDRYPACLIGLDERFQSKMFVSRRVTPAGSHSKIDRPPSPSGQWSTIADTVAVPSRFPARRPCTTGNCWWFLQRWQGPPEAGTWGAVLSTGWGQPCSSARRPPRNPAGTLASG